MPFVGKVFINVERFGGDCNHLLNVGFNGLKFNARSGLRNPLISHDCEKWVADAT